jgi:hypothetical protein
MHVPEVFKTKGIRRVRSRRKQQLHPYLLWGGVGQSDVIDIPVEYEKIRTNMEITLIREQGIYLLAAKSHMPKANEFSIKIANMLVKLRTQGHVSIVEKEDQVNLRCELSDITGLSLALIKERCTENISPIIFYDGIYKGLYNKSMSKFTKDRLSSTNTQSIRDVMGPDELQMNIDAYGAFIDKLMYLIKKDVNLTPGVIYNTAKEAGNWVQGVRRLNNLPLDFENTSNIKEARKLVKTYNRSQTLEKALKKQN